MGKKPAVKRPREAPASTKGVKKTKPKSPVKKSITSTKSKPKAVVTTAKGDSVTMAQLVTHYGGCHCGAVRYSVQASTHLDIVQCNCTICLKKQNHHFIVPKSRFKLTKGKNSLTTYTFNTHVAKHTFCKVCGVQSFYSPRSNPDGYGIMPHCLDPGTVESTDVIIFGGDEWEKSFQKSNITEYSKEPSLAATPAPPAKKARKSR